MPELRRDPVVGYWTIISTERGRRPVPLKPKESLNELPCPFCEQRESQAPWDVRVTLSPTPLLSEDSSAQRYGEGLYDLMNATGRHELIIETPEHQKDIDELSQDQLQKVISAYVQRVNEFEKDPRIKYALLYKNHGPMTASARDLVSHARSQLIGMPIVPKRVKEELAATKNYFQRHERCVFCDILRQETSEGTRVVFQNEAFFAFCPFASRYPFEIWILPKVHGADFGHLNPSLFAEFAQILKVCLAKIRILLNDPPYNFILHTAPYRRERKAEYWKTLEEDTHWYWLISPRLTHDAGFEWGTGIHINPTPPEDAALLLRETDAPTA